MFSSFCLALLQFSLIVKIHGGPNCGVDEITDGTRLFYLSIEHFSDNFRCYFLSDKRMEFDAAREVCVNLRYELVTVTDMFNNNFLVC